MYDHNITIAEYANYIADMADLYGDTMPSDEEMATMFADALERQIVTA